MADYTMNSVFTQSLPKADYKDGARNLDPKRSNTFNESSANFLVSALDVSSAHSFADWPDHNDEKSAEFVDSAFTLRGARAPPAVGNAGV